MDTPISKPALLKQTFELGSAYSGNIFSLNKMLGSLQDAGNTSTLAGYINLLDESGMLCSLQKYSVDMSRRRASIPKFQVYNNALKMVFSPLTLEQAIVDCKTWGLIPESAVGAYLVSQAFVHLLIYIIGANVTTRSILFFTRTAHWWPSKLKVMQKSEQQAWINLHNFSIPKLHLSLGMEAYILKISF